MGLIEGPDVAGLLDALGRHGAAELLQWSDPRGNTETPSTAEVADELDHAIRMLSRLESLLCKNCAKKWKEQQ